MVSATDVERLKAEGFELSRAQEPWAVDQYKGINSQWRRAGDRAAL